MQPEDFARVHALIDIKRTQEEHVYMTVEDEALDPLSALEARWRDDANRSRPMEDAPITAEKRARTQRWMLLTNCANELRAARAHDALPATLVKAIAAEVLERGRKHCSGEPLYFDRHNLELAIEAALAAALAPNSEQEK